MHEPLGAERPQDARGPQGRAATCRSSRPARCRRATAPTRPGAREWTQAVARGPRGAAADRELDEGSRPHLQRRWRASDASRDSPRASPAAYRSARRRSARPAARRPSYPPASPAGQGMFGVQGTGDTSGFGGLVRRRARRRRARPRPYGGYFDEVSTRSRRRTRRFDDAIEKVVVDRGELTLHIVPERIAEVCQVHARRRGAALRAVLLGVRCGLPRRRRAPAARGLPPDLDDLPAPGPAGGRGHRRGPAPAERDRGLPDRRLAGAGDVRHVRRRLRRPPRT